MEANPGPGVIESKHQEALLSQEHLQVMEIDFEFKVSRKTRNVFKPLSFAWLTVFKAHVKYLNGFYDETLF